MHWANLSMPFMICCTCVWDGPLPPFGSRLWQWFWAAWNTVLLTSSCCALIFGIAPLLVGAHALGVGERLLGVRRLAAAECRHRQDQAGRGDDGGRGSRCERPGRPRPADEAEAVVHLPSSGLDKVLIVSVTTVAVLDLKMGRSSARAQDRAAILLL
jgi:hypothetical protein